MQAGAEPTSAGRSGRSKAPANRVDRRGRAIFGRRASMQLQHPVQRALTRLLRANRRRTEEACATGHAGSTGESGARRHSEHQWPHEHRQASSHRGGHPCESSRSPAPLAAAILLDNVRTTASMPWRSQLDREVADSVNDRIIIDRRFNGPPNSANGGYTCGLVGTALEAPSVRVSLRKPPPLEVPAPAPARR